MTWYFVPQMGNDPDPDDDHWVWTHSPESAARIVCARDELLTEYVRKGNDLLVGEYEGTQGTRPEFKGAKPKEYYVSLSPSVLTEGVPLRLEDY